MNLSLASGFGLVSFLVAWLGQEGRPLTVGVKIVPGVAGETWLPVLSLVLIN